MATTSNTHNPLDGEYVRLKDLIQVIPFSPATVWRKAKNGTFPKPIKLSAQITAWRVKDIRAWLLACENTAA